MIGTSIMKELNMLLGQMYFIRFFGLQQPIQSEQNSDIL